MPTVKKTHILLAACLSCPWWVRAEVRSAAELRGLYQPTLGTITTFRVQGFLAGKIHEKDFVFEDQSGRTAISNHTGTDLHVGDIVIAEGEAMMIPSVRGKACAQVRKVTVIGKRQVPPPVEATIPEVLRGKFDYRDVRVTGTVIDTMRDDIDPTFHFLILYDAGVTIAVVIQCNADSSLSLEELRNSKVSATGICNPASGGSRRFHRHSIFTTRDRILTLESSDAEIFDAKPIDMFNGMEPSEIATLPERRSVIGCVIATWHGNRAILRKADGDIIQLTLAHGQVQPPTGNWIRAVGFPETDLFTVNLSSALWQPEQARQQPDVKAIDVSSGTMRTGDDRHARFDAKFHGKLIRTTGSIRALQPDGYDGIQILLENGDSILLANLGTDHAKIRSLSVGTKVSITGICLLESENWRPNIPFPRVSGMTIVLRSSEDIKVLSTPPWWTPARLLIVIGALLLGIASIFIWNVALRRIVERRSKDLLKEQLARVESELKVDERTRLSVELHDTLSQNLLGASMEINTAEQIVTQEDALLHLGIASKTLRASRDELRNCLWDLRSQALEEPDMNAAIRKTLEPYVCDVDLQVRFNVPREIFTDNTAHALMRIIRELVLNAIRHGHAKTVKIAGSRENGLLLFSVRDDGCGFDPSAVSGVGQGHFGLQGVRERLRLFKGSVRIDSSPGTGTYVSARLQLPTNETEKI